MGSLLRSAAVFGLLCLIYAAWMTGGTFRFDECRYYPTYNMLGEAMAHGRVHFPPGTVEDTVIVDGKAYLYAGPLPAVLRIPFFLLWGKGLPTGLMVVLFCAAASTLFPLALREVAPSGEEDGLGSISWWFGIVMMLNGYNLFMVTVPSVHHEAISVEVFFLVASVYTVFRALNRPGGPTAADGIYIGLSFAGAVTSRAACVPAIAVLGLYFAFDLFRRRRQISFPKATLAAILAGGIAVLAVGALLAYNFSRFGSPFDFGMHNQQSLVFHDYFKAGNYFRYDHLALNLWNIFFKLPTIISAFPYLLLPAYVLKIQSVALLPYQMVHSNELAVSIFCMMPISVTALFPLVKGAAALESRRLRDRYVVLGIVFWILVLAISLTVATTARYYYEFLPILLMLSYLGASSSKGGVIRARPVIIGLALLSIVLSFSVPLNAVFFFPDYLLCNSPLVALFRGP
jgi:hypothetical protein